MYPAARIVAFVLTLIGILFLVPAVLVWFVPIPIPAGMAVGPGQPDNGDPAKIDPQQVAFMMNLVRAAISAGWVVAALVILLFCDLVRAVVNTARDTRALLQAMTRGPQGGAPEARR